MVKQLDCNSFLLVTDSWQAAKRTRSFEEKLGVLLLTKIFELEPLTKSCFGFRNDLNPATCSGLARMGMLIHSKRLIETFDSCLSLLGPDDELLTTLLLEAGSRHVKHGVQASYVRFMGDAILFALAEVLGTSAWSSEVEQAWLNFYEVISADVIKGIQQHEQKGTLDPSKHTNTRPPRGKHRRPKEDTPPLSTVEVSSESGNKSLPSVEEDTKAVRETVEYPANNKASRRSSSTSTNSTSSSNSSRKVPSKTGGYEDSIPRGSLAYHFSKIRMGGSLTGSSEEDGSVASSKASSNTKKLLGNKMNMKHRLLPNGFKLTGSKISGNKGNQNILSILDTVTLDPDGEMFSC